MYFWIVDEVAPCMISMGDKLERADFRDRWVYVEVGMFNPLLGAPRCSAVPNPGWERQELLAGSAATPLLERLQLL